MINYSWNNTEYLGETDPEERNRRLSDGSIETAKRRRRIEDIKEAARLEREALCEVWEI